MSDNQTSQVAARPDPASPDTSFPPGPRRWVSRLFYIAMAAIFILSLLFPDYSESPGSRLLPVLVAGIVIAGFHLPHTRKAARRVAARLDASRRSRAFSYIVLFLVLVALAYLVAHAMAAQPFPADAGAVYRNAVELVDLGKLQWPEYFLMYPNNRLALFGEVLGYKAVLALAPGLELWHVLIAVNVVFVALAGVAVVRAAHVALGSTAALGTVLLWLALVSTSAWVAMPYSDAGALVAVSLLVLCGAQLVRARSRRRALVWAIALGLVSALGYLIKPPVVLVLLGLLAAIVLYRGVLQRHKGLRVRLSRAATVIVALVVFAAGVVGVPGITRATGVLPSEIYRTHDTAFPISHFIAMGLTKTGKPGSGVADFGGYYGPDVASMRKAPTWAAKQGLGWSKAGRRLVAWGPVGYVNFLRHKVSWIYSDGTFGTARWLPSGTSGATYQNTGPADRAVREVLTVAGPAYQPYRLVLDGVWLGLLGCIALRALRRWRDLDPGLFVAGLAIAILLQTGYLAVSEARSRYLFCMLPVFILVAVGSVRGASQWPRWLRRGAQRTT